MARDFDFPEESREQPIAPLLWVSHDGFRRATGLELRTPVREEREERLRQGLATLDNDFPEWLDDVQTETEDGLSEFDLDYTGVAFGLGARISFGGGGGE